MRPSQRVAVATAGICTLALSVAPSAAAQRLRMPPAQRGGPAGPDTKRLLVAIFRSDDKQLGVQASDAVRQRVQDEYTLKQLWVVPKREMSATLTGSGFPEDSALAITDLMELGRTLRADYYVDAVARKTAEGVAIEPRLQLRRGTNILTQPLPLAAAKNVGDAAKTLLKALDDALKAMPAYIACEADLRAQRYEAAAAAGRAALAAYPGSAFGRICLLSAFNYGKAPPDSIVRVANEILASDSTSMLALTNLADAYLAKGDTAQSTEIRVTIWHLDESNRGLVMQLIAQFVNMGKTERGLSLTEDVLRKDPTDAQLLRTRWQLLLRLKRYREAIAAGQELVKADSSAFTREYGGRTGAAAMLDSQPQVAATIYARAVERFPNDAELQLAYAQVLARLGQLDKALVASQRAVAIDPKIESGYLYVLSLQLQLKQLDSAAATAPKAIANGAPKDKVGEALLVLLAPAVAKAQASSLGEDWQQALTTSKMVDQILPTPATKFYIGLANYSLGAIAANNVQDLITQLKTAKPAAQKDLKTKACEQTRMAEDSFAMAIIAMSVGGGHDKTAGAAIMTNLQQAGEFVTQAKAAFCK